MKHLQIQLFIATLLSVSCSERQQNTIIAEQLPLSVKTEAVALQIDTVLGSEAFINANKFFVYKDSTLVVINNATDQVPYVEFRNLSDHRLIRQDIPLGKGPGEMLQLNSSLQGNTLLMKDFVRRNLAFVNMDSLLQDTAGYQPPPFRHYQVMSPGISILEGGKLVFENPYCFNNAKLGIQNKDAARLFIGDENTTTKDFGIYDYATYNVSQGNVISNSNKDRIIYASLNFPIIEVYDNQTKLIKKVEGPDSFESQNFIVDEGGVAFKGPTVPYAYLTHCYNDDYIYLSYAGELLYYRDKSEKDLKTWIFQFDWDGNFINSYYYDNYVNAISISGDGKAIYASARDKDNMPVLVKLSGLK